MFLREDSEYEVPYSTIKCRIITSVKDRPQWSWQQYMMLVYFGTGIPSISMRSWRKLFWRICIVYLKQDIILHKAQISYLINMWPWGLLEQKRPEIAALTPKSLPGILSSPYVYFQWLLALHWVVGQSGPCSFPQRKEKVMMRCHVGTIPMS